MLEALDHEALGVLVGEAVGADDAGHPLAPGPVLDPAEERADDLRVLPGLQEAEAGRLLVPVLVVAVVDDPHDPADAFGPAPGQEEEGVAIAERLVLRRIEVAPVVHVDRMDPLRVVRVELFGQVDERPEVLFALHFPNVDAHVVSLHGRYLIYPTNKG